MVSILGAGGLMEADMKTILLMVHDDEGMEARFQCALDVARAVEGRLLCLDLMRLPMVVDGFASPETVIVEDEERCEALAERLGQRLAVEAVPHEWTRAQGAFDRAIAERARLVDLVVVNDGSVVSLGDQSDIAGHVAALTSVPVLVVPPGQRSLDLFGKAVVAWDGEAAACDAVRAAVPLLRFASVVTVVTIGGAGDPSEVARYLADHGCKVEIREMPRIEAVAEQLADVLRTSHAAWGVMGCYGHSRLREMLFGGPSRSLLASAPVPLLIAH